jgi:transmembrane sensor
VTLEDAVAEMNRYSATAIRIEDPDLAALRLSSTFPAREPEDFAASRELLLPVRAQKSGNEIWLRPVEIVR